MNDSQTIEKMRQMKLYGMARAMESAVEMGIDGVTADEFVAHLIDAEYDDRHERRFKRLSRAAKFRYKASMEEIDFSPERNLPKNLLVRFSDCSFIKDRKNLTVTGPTGSGKSFLASALGNQACIYGYRTFYFNISKLFSQLKLAKADGTYIARMEKMERAPLVILDDFGLSGLDTVSRLMLLEILEDRHGLRSTIITSQLPVSSWHEVIGDPTIADAICDRIINSSYRIELGGNTLRKKYN
jgi:DNA replication protein DnaC